MSKRIQQRNHINIRRSKMSVALFFQPASFGFLCIPVRSFVDFLFTIALNSVMYITLKKIEINKETMANKAVRKPELKITSLFFFLLFIFCFGYSFQALVFVCKQTSERKKRENSFDLICSSDFIPFFCFH